jgi:cell division ATPase FtsA
MPVAGIRERVGGLQRSGHGGIRRLLTDEQPGARVEDVGHEPRRLVPTAELQRFVDERHRLLVAALLMRLREHVQPVGEQPTSSSLPRTRPTGLGENLDGVVRGAEACEQASCCTQRARGPRHPRPLRGGRPRRHAPTALPCSSAACSAWASSTAVRARDPGSTPLSLSSRSTSLSVSTASAA